MKQNGMTMIEVLVVLSIFAVLAGVAAPNFAQWIADSRLEARAIEIRQMMALSRSESIAQGRNARVELSGKSLIACLTNGTDTRCDDAPEVDQLTNVQWNDTTITILRNGSMSEAIIFDPRGRLTPRQSTIKLAFCDNSGRSDGWQLSINQVGRTYLSDIDTDEKQLC